MIEIATALVAFSSLGISFWTMQSSRKYKREYDPDGVTADYNAVETARALLSHPDILWRTFTVMRHYIGGYKPDELRKILVRAGAVRVASKDKREMWVLRTRMIEHTGKPYDFEPIFPIEPDTQADECYFPKLYEMPDEFVPESLGTIRYPNTKTIEDPKIT